MFSRKHLTTWRVRRYGGVGRVSNRILKIRSGCRSQLLYRGDGPLLPVLFGAADALFTHHRRSVIILVFMLVAFLSGMNIRRRIATTVIIIAAAVNITAIGRGGKTSLRDRRLTRAGYLVSVTTTWIRCVERVCCPKSSPSALPMNWIGLSPFKWSGVST